MAGYVGNSMSVNAMEAYNKGKKPVSRITKNDIQNFGINESISFFRWYITNYCDYCELHHSSPKFSITAFYDIKDCCEKLKNTDMEKLKAEYKKNKKPKPKKDKNEEPYFARVKYSISTYSGKRKYFDVYAIIHENWAYINDDYMHGIIKNKIIGKHFCIVERYPTKPAEIDDDTANTIMEKINSNKTL